eukprot:TRINITY_DN7415_c0_g1_i3.p1 TRINITY_DN7415_c0_g1~~TRINITY_DN7415_c0_g1_i3.p1  ORF type:complete len:448 (+),score=109.70 TRINITY_DN7415_c0_g1_i3:45-1346(+)
MLVQRRWACGCLVLWCVGLAGVWGLLADTSGEASAVELPDCSPLSVAVLPLLRRVLPREHSDNVRAVLAELHTACARLRSNSKPSAGPPAVPAPAPATAAAAAAAAEGSDGDDANETVRVAAVRSRAQCNGGPVSVCDDGPAEVRCGTEAACEALFGKGRYKPTSVQPFYPNKGRGRAAGWRSEWLRIHGALRRDASDNGGRARLVFIGDSITAALRPGTPSSSDATAPYGSDSTHRAMLRHFGAARPLALGIGGDETSNLIWRLQHGELGAARAADAAVLLIGTNNFNHHRRESRTAIESATGVGAVAWLLCRQLLSRRTRLIVLGVLPRAGPCMILAKKKRCRVSWKAKVDDTNAAVERMLPAVCPGGNVSSTATFVDCGAALLNASASGDAAHSPRLQPDLLHLSTEGYEALWSQCLTQKLRHLAPSLPL